MCVFVYSRIYTFGNIALLYRNVIVKLMCPFFVHTLTLSKSILIFILAHIHGISHGIVYIFYDGMIIQDLMVFWNQQISNLWARDVPYKVMTWIIQELPYENIGAAPLARHVIAVA